MTDTKAKAEVAAAAASGAQATASAPAESKARNVLTEGMPQPPGVVARRARRAQRAARKGPFVKYVGAASHRIIRASEWKSLGIDLKDSGATHEWNIKNDYMIEADLFSDAQLDYLLIDDVVHNGGHSFLEVDFDDAGQLVQVVDD